MGGVIIIAVTHEYLDTELSVAGIKFNITRVMTPTAQPNMKVAIIGATNITPRPDILNKSGI